MHEAVKNARDLKNKNAELAARVALAEELIQRLRDEDQKVAPLKLENAQLKTEVSHYVERAVLLEEELRWWKAQVHRDGSRPAQALAARLGAQWLFVSLLG